MTYQEIIMLAPQPVVYSIEFPNNMFYIGRSVDVSRRAKKHFQSSMLQKHNNLALNRCFLKYKNEVVWEIVKTFETAEQAVNFEEAYIDEFWDDPMFLNQKRGDKIDALYNERRHTKAVWYMNPYSGGMWRDETASSMRKAIGQKGYGKPLNWGHIAKGDTPEECRADADRILKRNFKKICDRVEKDFQKNNKRKEMLRIKSIKRKLIVKNLSTGKVWLCGKSDLNSSQRNVRTHGVRPWSEYNVRAYGGTWAEFNDAKQGWCEPKQVTATSKNGESTTYDSVGEAIRELFNIKSKSKKKHSAKQVRLAIKRNGTAYGYKWEYNQ